jgi:hypothetical protein
VSLASCPFGRACIHGCMSTSKIFSLNA